MSLFRPLMLLAIVVFTCFLNSTYSVHHELKNSNAFLGLYGHVLPAGLVSQAEDHASGSKGAEGHASGMDDEHGAGMGGAAGESEGAGGAHAADPLFAIALPDALSKMDWDHNADNGAHMVLTNLQLFQLAAILMIFIAFSGVPTYLRTGKGDTITRVMTGFCLYIRDEMAAPVMGEEAANKFMPFFFSLFFFILFCNLMGLVPGSATATASVFVTAALGLITFGSMIGCGMAAQGGLAFWKNLVPHVPGWLWPLMFLVEVIGLIVKPCALTIRLFANLTGGHMVVLSFMALIFFFAGDVGTEDYNAAAGWGVMLPAVGLGVFIMIIEAFVAMLQAYIFTLLSILFVGAAVHPDH
ncbi:MAG: F-type H+-transporting ATPase subunit a [Planctomycetota bacterium]